MNVTASQCHLVPPAHPKHPVSADMFDVLERMRNSFKGTPILAVTAAIGFLCFSTGCGRNDSVDKPAFDIPPSLVDRMRVSYNSVRNKMSGGSETLDGEEMMALMQLGYDNAPAIAQRPRGEMVFVDDGLKEEDRRRLWPFEVESFESTLEASLVRDEDGLYRKKDDDGDLFPFNPTMRWVNESMEQWAVRQLDAAFPRVKSDVYAKMIGDSVDADEEILMWSIPGNGGEYFAIERNEGAWNLRSYQYLLWDGADRPTLFAEFNSFPSRNEAVAMRTARNDSRSLHNMAVLYWRHRVFPMQFNPEEIKAMLEIAQREKVPCAKENLNVLRTHIPEVDQ